MAPALDEDYGLTVIEAMAWGAPVVVCEDGGSLAELVRRHRARGWSSLLGPQAIADAVHLLADDDRLAAGFRAAGRQAARDHFGWPNAFRQVADAIQLVMSQG